MSSQAVRACRKRPPSAGRTPLAPESFSNVVAGAAAGMAATLPMTGAIAVCQSRLPLSERFTEPPPHQVAMDTAKGLGFHSRLDLDERVLLTIVSHFGYGAAAGMLYGWLADDDDSAPVLRGIGFGCAVWGGSYLGWLPAAGFRAAAHRMSLRRNLMMFGAHVVWGATLGALFARRPRADRRGPRPVTLEAPQVASGRSRRDTPPERSAAGPSAGSHAARQSQGRQP